MEEHSHNPWIAATVIALLIGTGGGYYYGHLKGVEKGRANLLAEQEESAKKAKEEAQKQIAEQVNPFKESEANPFEGSYKNPFEKTTNPFAQ